MFPNIALIFTIVTCAAQPYRSLSSPSSTLSSTRLSSHSGGWSFGYHHHGLRTPAKGSWSPRAGGSAWGWPPGIPTSTPSDTDRMDTGSKSLGQAPQLNSVTPVLECREGIKVYQVGDKWTPEGACGRRTCAQGGKTTILGCPSIEPNKHCTMTGEDPRQPWPLCCPQLQCNQ